MHSSALPAAAAAAAMAIVWAVTFPATGDAFPRLHADPLVWLEAILLPLGVVGVLSHAWARAAHDTTRLVIGFLVAGTGLVAMFGTLALVDSVVAPDSDSSTVATPPAAQLAALFAGMLLVGVSIVVGRFSGPSSTVERPALWDRPDAEARDATASVGASVRLVERWALVAVVGAVGLVAFGGILAAADVHSDLSAPGGCGSVLFARSTGGLPCDDDRDTAALVATGLAAASLVLSTAAIAGARGLRAWRRSTRQQLSTGSVALRALAAAGVLAALALVGTEVTTEAGTEVRCGSVIEQVVDAGSPDNGYACLRGYQERVLEAGGLTVGAVFAFALTRPSIGLRGDRVYAPLSALARASAIVLIGVVVLNGSWFEVAVGG